MPLSCTNHYTITLANDGSGYDGSGFDGSGSDGSGFDGSGSDMEPLVQRQKW